MGFSASCNSTSPFKFCQVTFPKKTLKYWFVNDSDEFHKEKVNAIDTVYDCLVIDTDIFQDENITIA